MTEHIDETRLNDYLEHLVADEVAKEMEAHLGTCEQCHESLTALERLLSEMGDLPSEATPSRDLWPEVRARMDSAGASEEDGVVPLRTGGTGSTRRFSFSMGQLLAASITLAFISGATVWMVLNGAGNPNAGTLASEVASEVALPSNVVPAVHAASTQYEQAIASLESVLEQGRNLLDPETLATIEESLSLVDRAINEARAALAEDPNNDLLNRLLIQNQQSKLRVLRQASAAVQI